MSVDKSVSITAQQEIITLEELIKIGDVDDGIWCEDEGKIYQAWCDGCNIKNYVASFHKRLNEFLYQKLKKHK